MCNRDQKVYVGWGKRLSTALCLLTISFCIIYPAFAGAAGSEAPVEEKGEAVPKKKYRLSTKSGGRLLPIPLFLTEPAIGYGLGAALGYIHPTKDDS
jgi:hypothetical protein